MQTVIDDILINYEILGQNNKSYILIIHGWQRNLNDWIHIAKSLSEKNKVVLVDLPGMGSSSLPQKAFNTNDYALLIEKFIEKLKLNNLVLIGHSFGGKISTIIASRNRNIKTLILIDASGINEKNFLTSVKILFAKIFKPVSFIIPQNIFQSNDYKNAGPLLPTFKKIVSENVEVYAKNIKINTLIIWGDKDKEVTLISAKKFRELIPNSHLRIIWNTAHDPFLQKPDKFLEVIYEYL